MPLPLPIFQSGFRLIDGSDLNQLVGAVAGLQSPGVSFFVDETNGSDSNDGSAASPFATLTTALAACTAGAGDVVFFTGTIHTTATLTWNKNNTHLIGLNAPSDNSRARISASGTTVFTPFVNVTAQGCRFQNFATFYGFASDTAQVCWAEAGGRNMYSGVQFFGMGNTTAAANAGGRNLTVAGSGENVFYGCTVGLDTVTRATGNTASLEFLAGTPRNIFRDTIFQALSTNSANVHVLCGVGGMDRFALFQDCTFINAISSGGSAQSAAFSINASAGGLCLLQRSTSIGSTKISAAGPVYVDGGVPTGSTTGLAVAAS